MSFDPSFSPPVNDTGFQDERRPQLSAALRRREDASPSHRPSTTHWFYIVDPGATSEAGSDALPGRGVVLGLSATVGDAIIAIRNGLGIVPYVELNETERRDMTARIDTLRDGESRAPTH